LQKQWSGALARHEAQPYKGGIKIDTKKKPYRFTAGARIRLIKRISAEATQSNKAKNIKRDRKVIHVSKDFRLFWSRSGRERSGKRIGAQIGVSSYENADLINGSQGKGGEKGRRLYDIDNSGGTITLRREEWGGGELGTNIRDRYRLDRN